LVALCLQAFGCVAAQAPAADLALGAIEQEIVRAEGELGRTEERYREIPELLATDDHAERMMWGEVHFLAKDYERASELLFGAVQPRQGEARRGEPPVEQLPGYAEAVFQLAESLFALGNLAAARTYFESLLALPRHGHRDEAILRLMEIAGTQGRPDLVEKHYADYLATSNGNFSGQLRYLHGKSLFATKKDDAANAELQLVPPGHAYWMRARYLMGAILVRRGRYEEALKAFTEIAKTRPIANEDKEVREMAHLARGRLFYELDRLPESIDAYQSIPYDSPLLTTMLYEVTWTYVRRGQIALRGEKGDNLTEMQRRERAKVEYEKALRQLDDLRALEPQEDRAADIDILAGNLRLQRNEFTEAEGVFNKVIETYRDADAQLQALTADRDSRERVLSDILAMSSGGLTVDSTLPPIVARRAAENEDVVDAVRAFKGIDATRAEAAAAARLLAELEEDLSPTNPARTALFKPLQDGVEASTLLSTKLTNLKGRVIDLERSLVTPTPELAARLDAMRAERATLEEKLSAVPQTTDAVIARKVRLLERLTRISEALHQAELETRQRRAELTAIDFMIARDPTAQTGSAQVENKRATVRDARAAVEGLEKTVGELKRRIALTKKQIGTAGGPGSEEDELRDLHARALDEEHGLLQSARDPAAGATMDRIDGIVRSVASLSERNAGFRKRLDGAVEARLVGARA
jgi:tetratricopeptide (TPR) repeat protein